MRLLVFILSILYYCFTYSQNVTHKAHWVFSIEGTNSFRYEYYGNNLNPAPNQTFQPVGIKHKSNFGVKINIGKTDPFWRGANFDYGIEFFYSGKQALRNKDSLQSYYDTTGIIYDFRHRYNSFGFAIPFGFSYYHKKTIIQFGVSLPVLIYRSYKYDNFERSSKSVRHNYLWNIKFPTSFLYFRIAYSIDPKINLCAGFYYNSNILFDSRLYSFGIQYTL